MYKRYLLFIFLLIHLNCLQQKQTIPQQVELIIHEVTEQYCPDSRLSVFFISPKIEKNNLVLAGEVISEEGKAELIQRLTELKKYNIIDQIVTLPQGELGEQTYGVIRNSVAHLRSSPGYKAEMISQALMGSKIRILKNNDINKMSWWQYCQMEDGYLGWISKGSYVVGDELLIREWEDKEKVVVTVNYAQVLETPAENSLPVCDLVRGNKLAVLNRQANWIKAELPDGRRGFVQKKYVIDEQVLLNLPAPTAAQIISTAKSLTGIPYLWGGTSTKALDCSGFTQSVFKFNGIQLPRDANMQVFEGEPVSIQENLDALQPADLLFWGPTADRITHVGIYVGNHQFIHCDDLVRVDSLNPEDENYNEYRHRTLRAARRILN